MGAVRLWDVSHTYRHIKASFYGAVSVGESQPHPHIWHCGATVGAEGHKPWAVFSQQSFKEEVLSLWCLILMRHVHRSLFIIAVVMLLLLCVWPTGPAPTQQSLFDTTMTSRINATENTILASLISYLKTLDSKRNWLQFCDQRSKVTVTLEAHAETMTQINSNIYEDKTKWWHLIQKVKVLWF